ncbi:hypothetical protein [Methylosinus sporium]|uniref:Uncharacterized protein n=1 Tax=Methylosinus sporium TaxID=428 RepID=A0A2U1SSN0_METSR|nr:hypothetical protein [Methylosinus sporium]PWB94626.1 hypothetical protein C5689_06070 [Methylosinus sporium]
MLTINAGANNAALESAAHIVDEAAAALGGQDAPGVAELRDASVKIRALISNPHSKGKAMSETMNGPAPSDIVSSLKARVAELEGELAESQHYRVKEVEEFRAALAASRRQVEAMKEALDEIEGLSRHLRHGGCDASDLAGLEEGLSQAVGLAHDALSALDAPKPSAAITDEEVEHAAMRSIGLDPQGHGASYTLGDRQKEMMRSALQAFLDRMAK